MISLNNLFIFFINFVISEQHNYAFLMTGPEHFYQLIPSAHIIA